MKKYLLGFTLGCTICLQPTLAFGQTNPATYSTVSGASISGAVTYQNPEKAVTTITGQITLPQNLYYDGKAIITYESLGTPGTTDFRPTSLTLTPALYSIQVVDTSSSISAQTSAALKDALDVSSTKYNLPKAISIIRAAGGGNGLE